MFKLRIKRGMQFLQRVTAPTWRTLSARHNRPFVIAGLALLIPLCIIVACIVVLNSVSTMKIASTTTYPKKQTPSQQPSTTTSPTSPAGTPPGNGSVTMPEYPGLVVSLTSWKLTLPINSDDSKSPDEIKQPELATYSNSSYFFLNPDRTGIVLRAPITGATTSGSNYPRSELREMTSDGNDEASWSTGHGVSTMSVTEAVTHLPVAKPEVVAAQIHGPSEYLILIRLEGNNLFVEKDGKNIGTLNPNYQLGTVYTVTITADNGTVTVQYNGEQKAQFMDSSTGNYFKAGCYTQSNTKQDEPDGAYGEVTIYKLSVSHS